MPEPTIKHAEDNFEEVYLVGFRLQPDSAEVDFYALVLYYEVARNDSNRPLTSGGRIVFFRDPSQADRILALGDAAFRKYRVAPVELAYVYDMPRVLALLASDNVDDSASILNLINELLDFVVATGYTMPKRYKRVLAYFADWLTFEKSFSDFFPAHLIERTEVLDALLWSVGAVASRALLVK